MLIKKSLLSIIICGMLFLFSGCRSAYLVDGSQPITDQMAVVLIDVRGALPINYMQFYAGYPAINVRFDGITNDIIAVVVEPGIPKFQFNTYTFSDIPAWYLPSGTAVGFFHVDSEPISVMEPGVYFLGALDTDNRTFNPVPDELQLLLIKVKYEEIFNILKPINFKLPGD